MTDTLTDKIARTLEIDKHLLVDFVDATLKRRQLARDDKVLKEQLADLTETILQQFEDAEMVESIRVKGYNIKPAREVWAGAKDGDFERSCAALVATGHSDYVNERFDSRRVSALIRDYEEGEGIPEELSENLSITEKFKISMTKGPTKRSKK